MSDIRDVLDRTARSADAAPSDETVEGDVRRGRAASRRRRVTRFSVAGLAAVVVVAGTALVAGNLGHSPGSTAPRAGQQHGQQHGQTPGRRNSQTPRSGPKAVAPVRLVAYRGDQPKGFTVAQVPEGWFLQGTNAFSLTVAPNGDTTSPDGFEGKLVVMLLSSSAPQRLPQGDPVEVGGNAGVISHGPPADTLTYRDDAGHFVQVQAWTSALHWTNDQLVSFAEGVQVTAAAQPGVG